ncbi:hypothetical protein FS837_002443, partial [Tulasnella sp. UAMH 9824]
MSQLPGGVPSQSSRDKGKRTQRVVPGPVTPTVPGSSSSSSTVQGSSISGRPGYLPQNPALNAYQEPWRYPSSSGSSMPAGTLPGPASTPSLQQPSYPPQYATPYSSSSYQIPSTSANPTYSSSTLNATGPTTQPQGVQFLNEEQWNTWMQNGFLPPGMNEQTMTVSSPRPPNSATSPTFGTTYQGQFPSNRVSGPSNTVYPSFPGSYQAAPSLGSGGQQAPYYAPSGSSTSYQAIANIPQQAPPNPVPQQPDLIPGKVRGRKYQPGQGVFQAAVSSSSAASSSSQPPQPPVQGKFSVNPPPTIACSCNIQFD